MNIAIDAMGGDNAPQEIVKGARDAVRHFDNLSITLIGDEGQIAPLVENDPSLEVIHTKEVITSEDEPVRAVRRKKNASLVLMANEVKEGLADACISAGNTGALMSAGLFIIGRIKGIDRPALSPTLPTLDESGFLFLDVGANVDAKPNHLLQYAIMGSTYVKNVRGVDNPRVGLLNIGTEEGKGNELTKKSYELIRDSELNFVGNVESRDLLNGLADVVVTDGFTGNIALKTVEGTAMNMFSMLKQTLTATMKTKFAASLVKDDLKRLKGRLDYSEYGGAGLFGLSAPVIKAHGSSDARAVYNAIKQAVHMVEEDVTNRIADKISEVDVKEEQS
ncbi:phosphate acyltransferase PlsX [Thalassobacillus sp. CUG 92003]|uniref:phosphate acyltransferase PlsX n=1 Tax=Thalassobacillus sp. CUG 92003 TaxID=2736641 RepID=UPI0015E6E3F2|nr:phosphate acyltransferase PlsX [Thalassobacillus sp. CUG 92003]